MSNPAIEYIDRQIEHYTAEIRRLQEARKLLEGGAETNHRTTRFDQVYQLLQLHGPMRRRQILAETKMSDGSLSWVLTTYRDKFNRKQGQWSVNPRRSPAVP